MSWFVAQPPVVPDPVIVDPAWWEPFLDSVPGTLSGLILALTTVWLGWRHETKRRSEERAQEFVRWERGRKLERSQWLRNETARMTSGAAASIEALFDVWTLMALAVVAGSDPVTIATDLVDSGKGEARKDVNRHLADLRLIGRSDIADELLAIRKRVEEGLTGIVGTSHRKGGARLLALCIHGSEQINAYLDGLDLYPLESEGSDPVAEKP